MQLLGIPYGTEKELREEEKRLQKFIDEKCEGGTIRKFELWDIGFAKKYEVPVTLHLPSPQATIKQVISKILSTPMIGNMILKWINNENNPLGKVDVINDTREGKGSPEFVMLLRKYGEKE